VCQAQGYAAEAQALIQQAEDSLERSRDPTLIHELEIASARLALARGETPAAEWVRGYDLPPDSKAPDAALLRGKSAYLTMALIWLVRGEQDKTEHLLARLSPALRSAGHTGSVIEALSIQALACQSTGDTEQALDLLKKALTLAEPEGYTRTFADLGEPMRHLLQQAAVRDIAPASSARLLTAFGSQEELGTRPMAAPRPDQRPARVRPAPQLIEALNEQEQRILCLVSAGLSNSEVAEELFLWVNTVKWYLQEIYGKLGVHNRVEALARASELGLL